MHNGGSQKTGRSLLLKLGVFHIRLGPEQLQVLKLTFLQIRYFNFKRTCIRAQGAQCLKMSLKGSLFYSGVETKIN